MGWVALFWMCSAMAGPVSVSGGGTTLGVQLGARLSADEPSGSELGLELSVVTSGDLNGRAGAFTRHMDDNQVLVQPLLGPVFDGTLAGPVYGSVGFGFDLLAPGRAYLDMADWAPVPGVQAVMYLPATLFHAVMMGQLKLALGIRPVPAVAIEAGTWLAPAVSYEHHRHNTIGDIVGDRSPLALLRPGAQAVLHF